MSGDTLKSTNLVSLLFRVRLYCYVQMFSQSAGKTGLVVNKEVTTRIRKAVGKRNCNFVSIFGSAREGKVTYFLSYMNKFK